jgi:4-hydroxy-3-methylbut-2-enyl diphosphate reductase
MKILLAESAGFCFGVDRAVSITEKALASGSCWSLGELIHNRDAVERLSGLGLSCADTAEDVPDGARVIIRSHGASRKECGILAEKGCVILYATCPRVSRIHRIVERAGREGRLVVIFGEPAHPEIQGICGWNTGSVVVSNLTEFVEWAGKIALSYDAPLTVVFQTTSNKKSSEQIINSLKKEYTNAEFFDTICDATSIRQAEARDLSGSCDAMVVVGGFHSANSIHLAEICRE